MAAAPESTQNSAATPDWAAITEQIRCPLCEYNLRGLIEPRCPECGYRFEWPDVLDPRRRLHPYLFEHHPERNLRSFARTAVAGFRPGTFWRSLNPAQPSRPKRLVLYWLIGVGVLVGALLSQALVGAVRQAGVISADRANALALFRGLPPVRQQQLMQREGVTSLQTLADRWSPMPPFHDLMLQSLVCRGGGALIVFGIWLIAWPWLSLLALLIFRWSMRRAGIRRIHVLRCCIYSFDLAPWFGLALIAAAFLPIGAPWDDIMVAVGLPVAMIVVGSWRLRAAYKYYLRLDRPLSVVIASQVIAILVAWILLTLPPRFQRI